MTFEATGPVVGIACRRCRQPITAGQLLEEHVEEFDGARAVITYEHSGECPSVREPGDEPDEDRSETGRPVSMPTDVVGQPVGKDFILAGNATFTLVGRASRFTFNVKFKQGEDGRRGVFFVSLRAGTGEGLGYRYLGVLDAETGGVRVTRKSGFEGDEKPVVALRWALGHIWKSGRLPAGELMHAGKCGRCGRKLTDPDSIRTGFGPECAGRR